MSTVIRHGGDDHDANWGPTSNTIQEKGEGCNIASIPPSLSPARPNSRREDLESLENGNNKRDREKFGEMRLMGEAEGDISNNFLNRNLEKDERRADKKLDDAGNEQKGNTTTPSTKQCSYDLETNKSTKLKDTMVLNKNNQRLIRDSKQRIRERFDELEHRLDLQVDRKQLQISEGDLSLEDLGSSIDTVASSSRCLADKELAYLTNKLRLKEDEIVKLSKFRSQVELELDDLTACLFEEANRMVWEAKTQRAKAEKALKEANMKIDVLQAEVKALKVLVLTSSPTVNSRTLPSSGLAQRNGPFGRLAKSSKTSGLRAILQRASLAGATGRIKSASSNESGVVSTNKSLIKHHHPRTIGCKRSSSNFDLGEESVQTTLKDGTIYQQTSSHTQIKGRIHLHDENISISGVGEIDPLFFEEFILWRKIPKLDLESSGFIKRLYQEEIRPALNFKNQTLTQRLVEAISHNNVIIELNTDSSVVAKLVVNTFSRFHRCINKPNFKFIYRKCALLELPRICRHRIKVDEEWLHISQLARDRISAVCDLFCYLRYIQQGLVKSERKRV